MNFVSISPNVPLSAKPMLHALFPGGSVSFAFSTDVAHHDRLCCVERERQQVLDAAIGNVDGELDMVIPRTRQVLDRALDVQRAWSRAPHRRSRGPWCHRCR